MNRLEGKVAIITGGASGIGLAAAKLFVEEGARVLITDLNESGLQAAVDDIGSDHAAYTVGNVTSIEDNQEMVAKAVELFGGVDILAANAGIEGDPAPLLELDPEAFDLAMNINVRGPLLGMQAACPIMVERGGGSVVITSSVAATFGGQIGYATSKHAVTGLMRSAAKQLAAMNIRVNSVNPGPVQTPLIDRLVANEEVSAWLLAQIPMGRYAEPEEVAQAMLYLASEESSYVTGTVNMVDGGYRS